MPPPRVLRWLRSGQTAFRPAAGIDLGHQGFAKLFIARERVSADQGLELPGG